MQVALIFDPDVPDEVAKAARFFKYAPVIQVPTEHDRPDPNDELQTETDTESVPFEVDDLIEQGAKSEPPACETPSIADLRNKAAEIATAKGVGVVKSICERVGIARISECPADKLAKLAAEIALHV